MDVLSNVLGVTRLGTPVVNQSEWLRPWGLEVGARAKVVVHFVQRGECWLRLEGDPEPTRLITGDVVLVARGLRHQLTDAPHTPAEPYDRALATMRERLARPPALAGAAGPATRALDRDSAVLLCAEYELAPDDAHPLLALLPRLIHVHVDAARDDAPLQALVRLLLHEATHEQRGSELVVPRLVDSLLVFIVRAWLEQTPLGGAGWFGALRDPQIGRALALIHETPQHPWTVAELAARVAQSRAAFARRFAQLVGEPPLAYVTRWRMSLATKLLKETDEPVERIATSVGYDSPSSFGKAFRRHVRVTPGQYRLSTRP